MINREIYKSLVFQKNRKVSQHLLIDYTCFAHCMTFLHSLESVLTLRRTLVRLHNPAFELCQNQRFTVIGLSIEVPTRWQRPWSGITHRRQWRYTQSYCVNRGCRPADTRRWPNIGSLLGQRRRRSPTINPTLGQRLCLLGGHPPSGHLQ